MHWTLGIEVGTLREMLYEQRIYQRNCNTRPLNPPPPLLHSLCYKEASVSQLAKQEDNPFRIYWHGPILARPPGKGQQTAGISPTGTPTIR